MGNQYRAYHYPYFRRIDYYGAGPLHDSHLAQLAHEGTYYGAYHPIVVGPCVRRPRDPHDGDVGRRDDMGSSHYQRLYRAGLDGYPGSGRNLGEKKQQPETANHIPSICGANLGYLGRIVRYRRLDRNPARLAAGWRYWLAERSRM